MTRSSNQNVNRNISWRYLMLRYAIVTLLTMVLTTVVSVLLTTFASYNMSTSAGIVTAIVPALDAGQIFARRTKRQPGRGEAWRISIAFVVLGALISFGTLLLVTMLGAGERMELLPSVGREGLTGIIVATMTIYLLLIRFFFGWGAKNELKRLAKIEEKGR